MLAPSRTVVRWATKGGPPAMHVLSLHLGHSLSVPWIIITIAKLVLNDDLIGLSNCPLAFPFPSGVPVSDATLNLWRGFVSLILSAYFEKRMAWYPVDRLQLEVSATTGVLLSCPLHHAHSFYCLLFSTLHMRK